MTKKSKQPSPENDDIVAHLLHDWRRERPDLDVSAMAVVGRILHLADLLEARANAALKGMRISYTELDVLATLRRSGAPFQLTPTALRRSVLLTSGAMTACLNRLEKVGLLRRVADSADRRSLIAALTAKGKTLIDEAIAIRFAEAQDAIAGLSQKERTVLAGLLLKLSASMESPD